VAELADAADSKSAGALLCVGSTPSSCLPLKSNHGKIEQNCVFQGFSLIFASGLRDFQGQLRTLFRAYWQQRATIEIGNKRSGPSNKPPKTLAKFTQMVSDKSRDRKRRNQREFWWRWRESNPHRAKLRQILSLLRLPVPPHRQPFEDTTLLEPQPTPDRASTGFLTACRT
jgi:hypothetical protein